MRDKTTHRRPDATSLQNCTVVSGYRLAWGALSFFLVWRPITISPLQKKSSANWLAAGQKRGAGFGSRPPLSRQAERPGRSSRGDRFGGRRPRKSHRRQAEGRAGACAKSQPVAQFEYMGRYIPNNGRAHSGAEMLKRVNSANPPQLLDPKCFVRFRSECGTRLK